MGKKKQKNAPETKSSSPVPWIAAVVVSMVAVIAALMISGNMPFIEEEKETGMSFNLPGKETRPVLDPAKFRGQTRMAYAAAKKYPEMFNEVFCYCYCDEEPFNHSTLLSCFATEHGAG